ncbi:MAG: mechanosensitive ion channel domain-containing protein [Bacteroidota bacterium]
METYIEQIKEMAVDYAPRVLLALITLWIGFRIIAWVTRMLNNALDKREVDVSLSKFLQSLVGVGLQVMLLISVAGMFGVDTAAFVGILAAMAFAVGMALQGSLGNFASGVMILLFKPYKVGDLISAQGFTGVVDEIQIFNTILMTPDNKKIIIPNSAVTSGPITNISGQGEIRVDQTFGIGYDDDIDKARTVIQKVADSCPQILKDKPVDILVNELADSSVNFTVRPWAKSEHYWDVYFYMNENIKKEMDAASISIPYPQMDVHVNNPAGA